MKINAGKNLIISCAVLFVVALLSIVACAVLIKLAKQRAALEKGKIDKKILQDRGSHLEERSLSDEQGGDPHSQLEGAELSQDIPVPGLKNCFLSSDGILGPEGAETKPNWRGKVVIVDQSASVFKNYSYVREGDSGKLYDVLKIHEGPISESMREKCNGEELLINPETFRAQCYEAGVIHVGNTLPSRLGVSRVADMSPDVLRLALQLFFYSTFSRISWACSYEMRSFCTKATLLIPMVELEGFNKGLPKSEELEVFAKAFFDVFKRGVGETSTGALNVKSVKICCGDRETQLALAEAMDKVRQKMDQEAGKTPDSPAR
ncbi:hypothetical protein ACJZTR_00420 [Neorickettsia risticii]